MAAESSSEDLCHLQPEISAHLFMAAVSSSFAEVLTFPFDTVKVYLQLQHRNRNPRHVPNELELGSSHIGMKSGHSHHPSTIPFFSNLKLSAMEIYKNHGLRGFYRGWKPAVLRASLNNALSATIYKPVRKCLGYDDRNCPLYIKLSAGMLTGATTQILASPTDLLKVRMQADSTRSIRQYNGFRHAILKIYGEHGLLAFWKGLGPSMLRAGFSVAATLGTYDHCKATILSMECPIDAKDWRLHFVCSMASGLCATTLAVPFDVVKTRYQSQSMHAPIYRSARHCCAEIAKNEGLRVFTQGFFPMYCRLGPWQIAFFLTFEFMHQELLGITF